MRPTIVKEDAAIAALVVALIVAPITFGGRKSCDLKRIESISTITVHSP